ncbi:MAG: M24 family metallopeptidase [Desulfobacterales bacterium]
MESGINNDEYAARHQKARELMETKGLNALFITEPTNLFYFTGASYFGEMSFPRPAVLIIPLQGESILITHDFHLPIDWGGDIRQYQRVGELPIGIVKEAFGDTGCTTGAVGAELGHEQRLGISYKDFLRVQDALPEISFMDASDIFWQLRMVKSKTEIEILTRACHIQDSIFEQAFKVVETGMTTREIEKRFHRVITESEAGLGWVIVCIGDYDPRQAAGSSRPDVKLKAKDLLWVDLGIVMHGYHTDYCRGFVPDGQSQPQRDKWEKVRKALESGMNATRPGIAVSDLYWAQMKTAEKLNIDMETWTARRFGHGSGLHTTEPPYISPDDRTILMPGMILHIEPGCIEKDGIYVLEEQVLVTESGYKVLSHAPWQLQS